MAAMVRLNLIASPGVRSVLYASIIGAALVVTAWRVLHVYFRKSSSAVNDREARVKAPPLLVTAHGNPPHAADVGASGELPNFSVAGEEDPGAIVDVLKSEQTN